MEFFKKFLFVCYAFAIASGLYFFVQRYPEPFRKWMVLYTFVWIIFIYVFGWKLLKPQNFSQWFYFLCVPFAFMGMEVIAFIFWAKVIEVFGGLAAKPIGFSSERILFIGIGVYVLVALILSVGEKSRKRRPWLATRRPSTSPVFRVLGGILSLLSFAMVLLAFLPPGSHSPEWKMIIIGLSSGILFGFYAIFDLDPMNQ